MYYFHNFTYFRSVHCGLKPNNCKCGKGYRTKNELLRHSKNSCPVSRNSTTSVTLPASSTASTITSIETRQSNELILAQDIEDPTPELDLSHGYFSDFDFEYDVTSTNDFIHF